VIGKVLAKIWHNQKVLLEKLNELIKAVSSKGLELATKRATVVYIYEIVNKYASVFEEIRS